MLRRGNREKRFGNRSVHRSERSYMLTALKASSAAVVPIRTKAEPKAPNADDDVIRVMLSLPRRVKRRFDEMVFTYDSKAYGH
jgi:hypothetical protein